jgi:predicted nucleic acid-binding protein
VIYLDSSALLKLVFEEDESAALERWLARRTRTPKVASELAKVEVVRAARRIDADAVSDARALVSQLDLIPLTGAVVEQAAEVGALLLPSLDALHLVSALSVQDDLTAFVAYDDRLFDAAQVAGLAPVRPG